MQVFITDEANEDLDDIWMFVAQGSVESADRLLDSFLAKARSIGAQPLAAPVVSGRERHGTRRVNFRSWAIFYEIIREHVEVLSFAQGKNNPNRLPRRRR
jgi:plasmid stabilization system protein ParE